MIKISNNVYILLNLHTIPFRVPDMYVCMYVCIYIYIYIYFPHYSGVIKPLNLWNFAEK